MMHTWGVLDENKSSQSNQESKALNQESKALNQASKNLSWLPKLPRAMVKTVVAPGWQGVFDPGKGQLCKLIT